MFTYMYSTASYDIEVWFDGCILTFGPRCAPPFSFQNWLMT